MALCAKIGKCTCTIYEQKTPVCIQILRVYTGIGDAETQSPGHAEAPSPGMLRKPGDLPYPCPRPKKFKRLATRDTLHGSRPNLQQRDPNGRIMTTPSDVSDKSTKRCARRWNIMTIIRIYMPVMQSTTCVALLFLSVLLIRDVCYRCSGNY